MNILYFRAAGALGVMNNTAQTAPNGAIVIDNPLGANSWSILPNIAIPANAPREGHRTSLRVGFGVALSGDQVSQRGAAATLPEEDATTLKLLCLLLEIKKVLHKGSYLRLPKPTDLSLLLYDLADELQFDELKQDGDATGNNNGEKRRFLGEK